MSLTPTHDLQKVAQQLKTASCALENIAAKYGIGDEIAIVHNHVRDAHVGAVELLRIVEQGAGYAIKMALRADRERREAAADAPKTEADPTDNG